MSLKQIIIDIKRKIQFKRFEDGYYKGYKEAVKKAWAADGKLLRLSVTDMNVYSEFSKHPKKKRKWLYRPWKSGFDFGYTEAMSYYNSGEDPQRNNDTYQDQDFRIRKEFENLKEEF